MKKILFVEDDPIHILRGDIAAAVSPAKPLFGAGRRNRLTDLLFNGSILKMARQNMYGAGRGRLEVSC